MTRLAGGSKKGVYRIGCSDGFSAVLYVWSAAEDYWAGGFGADGVVGLGLVRAGAGVGAGADVGVFAHASGLGLFSASARRLTEAGVRVPRVYLEDGSRAVYPADIALVEDIRGGTLEELACERRCGRAAGDGGSWGRCSGRCGNTGPGVWGRLWTSSSLTAMGRRRLARVGAAAVSSAEIVLERALRHLDRAADRVPAVAPVGPALDETLRGLAAAVRPRDGYALIHGELGPDHVSIDDLGRPVVVDIEGAMYFDVEWEHAFLRLRFGRHYEWLRVDGLDERRMRLYALALDLSLIEGPLRLLDGDYPERELMLAIASSAVDRVLAAARR